MVSTIKFSEFSDGGNLENDNITVGLESGLNSQFNNPWTFLAPGTTGDRPIPAANMYYRLRLNTTLEIYEYYDPTIPLWVELSGSGTGTVNPGVVNDLAYYAASGQAVSPINSAANSVLVTSSGSVPSLSTTLPSGLSIPGATITSSTAALTSGQVAAVPAANTDIANKLYVDTAFGSGVTSITGTTNQVNVNHPTGAVTLSLPQDIATGSSPTFLGLTVGNLNFTNNTIISTNSNGNINFTPNGSGVNAFNKNITLQTAADPTFTIFSDDGLGTSFIQIQDTDLNQCFFNKTTSSGDSLIGINPLPLDGAGDARIKLFRSSNTTSLTSGVQIYKGDNTTSLQSTFRCFSDSFLNALAGGVTIGSGSAPTNKLDVISTSSGTTTSVIRLKNNTASGINSGVSLDFQPNGQPTRAASIRSIQTSAGNFADLEFYTCNNTTPALAMTISAAQIVSLTNALAATSGGTGVNNGSSTITLGGSLTTSGAFSSTFTMTGVTGVTFPTSGTLATTAQVIATAAIAGTTQTAAVNTIYIASAAGQTTLTLPSTYAVGSRIGLVGSTANTGGWIIATASGDTIRLNNTTGASSGTLTSAAIAGQCVELICDVADTSWIVMNGTYTTLTLS